METIYRIGQRGFIILGLWLCTCLMTLPALGQVAVTMDNGLTIQGQPGSIEKISLRLEPAEPFESKEIRLFNDGLRRVYVNQDRIIGLGDSTLSDTEVEIWQKTVLRSSSKGFGILLDTTRFDENGHRTLWVRNADGRTIPVVQGITTINPHWVEVQALTNKDTPNREWTMRLGTDTIPPKVLRNLLLRKVKDPNNAIERLDVVQFYIEAEQYRRAIEELAQIERDIPDARDDFRRDRETLRQGYGRNLLQEIRFRDSVGQTDLAIALANSTKVDEMSDELQADYADFRENVIRSKKNLEAVREEIVSRCQKYIAENPIKQQEIKTAELLLNEMQNELGLSNLARLATYSQLVSDSAQTEEQLLSYAISGWLLGNGKAIPNFAVSQSLFPVRDLVMEYLSTADSARRVQILNELKRYEGSEPEYLSAIINNITPPRAPDLKEYNGERALEFTVDIKGTKAQDNKTQSFRYLVHLPPGYDPQSKYPCMLTLRSGNTVEQQLERWAGSFKPTLRPTIDGKEWVIRQGTAIRHGYIVASLDWKSPGQGTYKYSAREHKVILKCMRQLLKQFSVDSDRFYISGHGFGGEAAYDVAIAHPEHFAGVIGIASRMEKYPTQYYKNKHLGLNVYSVVGAKDLVSIKSSTTIWNQWLKSSNYNSLRVVEYQGRLAESFPEEFPTIMEWCDASRRSWPTAGTAYEINCEILRPWDNYSWFIEFHGLPLENTTFPEDWPANNRGFNPLNIRAKLSDKIPNRYTTVAPKTSGRGITIWLAPEYTDFSKEVNISGRGGGFKGFVKPSREVILEDVRKRGDRKRIFWNKVELK